MTLFLKRVYEPAESSDGFRVLVDRLWPRGVSKEKAAVDMWLKEVGPSTELREWFGHIPEKYPEFEQKYLAELAQNPAAVELSALLRNHPVVTLVYGAKDEEHNQAQVLRDFLKPSAE
ncbi:MAG: DUF488 domain-containing protein [Microbacteriaceae bacterium]